jgi:trehalose/maltose transport system substrate-binding protein
MRWLILCAVTLGCSRPAAPGAEIVLKHQPLWGDPAPFHALLDEFRRANPGVALRTETLPNGSDIAREMLVTALEGGASDFDVFPIDVVWAPEFARAGWLADLSSDFPPARLRDEYLPGPVAAVTSEGRTHAVPWFVDVGLLYYRTDLVPRAPRTYLELEQYARAATRRDPSLSGWLWQGRQYEGLSCVVFEVIWGLGGAVAAEGRMTLEEPAARAALALLRSAIDSGLSPRSVISSAEEETRRAFQEGRAVFLRNWPYAWAEVQSEGSPVRGKVGWAPLPSASGAPGPGALGGWQLAINANAPPARRRAAVKLVSFLTSERAQVALALRYSRLPARRSAYDDPALRQQAPFIAALLPLALAARPRPLTPYYLLASDALQGELSAAISGLRSPAEALARAQRIADRLQGAP